MDSFAAIRRRASARPSLFQLTPEPELAIFVALAGILALSVGCNRNTKSADELETTTAAAPAEAPEGAGSAPGATPTPPSDPHAGLVAPAPKGEAPANPTAGGLIWSASHPIVPVPPSSAMRAAEYRVGEGESAGELTVYHFPGQGGSVQANIDRWVGQFTKNGKPVKDEAKVERREVQGMPVTTLDVTGTYNAAQMPGMPASGPKEDYRMLGAIVEGPAGPVFFKLTGPSATLESAKGAFDALVASVRPGS